MNMLFSRLPAEIQLKVLSYCHIQTILSVQATSKAWKTFIDENENSIYHSAAIVHRFIQPDETLDEVQLTHPGRWLDDVEGWKDLCEFAQNVFVKPEMT